MALETLGADLFDAETLLGEDDPQSVADAAVFLGRLAQDAEAYVAEHCPTTAEVQWFSFPTFFERLAYRRVEGDPRELRDVGAPLDRLYGDYAFALVRVGDYEAAREALMQAIRWNPMGCGARLDLAELCRALGDERQWLALSYSVFERASEVEHLVQAYVNFAEHFHEEGNPQAEAACLACAERFGVANDDLTELVKAATGGAADPSTLTAEEVTATLAAEGLPEGANAEVALCLIMCATDAQGLGDSRAALDLLGRARDLVGDEACLLLVDLVHEADEELAGAQAAGPAPEAQAAAPEADDGATDPGDGDGR